ncbi:MAG: hypothetical protein ACREJO_04350 [Phycisphaerales bacterium]
MSGVLLRVLVTLALIVQLALPAGACVCATPMVTDTCPCCTERDTRCATGDSDDHSCRDLSSRGKNDPTDPAVFTTASVDSTACVCLPPHPVNLPVQQFAADLLPSALLLDLAFPLEVVSEPTQPQPLVRVADHAAHVRSGSPRAWLCVWTI